MICPDCKNEFVQQFVCTTCGAEKLYDTTLANTQRELAAVIEALKIATQSADDQMFQKREAQAQRDKARNDALEEAAKICDEYANRGVVGARICAAAICARKKFGAHIKEMHEFIAENQRLIRSVEVREMSDTPTVKDSLTVQPS